MSLVRRATAEDAEEVLRLRQVMIDSMGWGGPPPQPGPPGPEPGAAEDEGPAVAPPPEWHAPSLPTLRARLADPDGSFAAFVVDRPERPGSLAALVCGTVEYRIGRADNPHGRVGHVFSVATDPDARRRGYARACMEELLEWFRLRGAAQVDLNASAQAEPLYASLGFTRKPDPSMRLAL